MKIAMLGAKSIPVGDFGGGIERHVEELAERLVSKGHKVYVYVRSRAMPQKFLRTWRGIHLVVLPTVRRKNLETIIHVFLSTLHVLFLPVDVVHYHGVGPATLAWLPRIFKPWAKIIVTFHSIDRFHKKWGGFARVYLNFGEWAAMHFPHQTIVVSHTLQLYVHRRFGKPGVFIPNGVEVHTVRRADELSKFQIKPREYLLTVARLIKHKGIHYLIQAFKGIKTDKKLVIVGAPSFTDDYAAYLARLAAEDPRIIFTGFQSGDTLDQLFAHAYLYIHPSESEGLSITILEAMAHGTAVLISNIPENMEIIDHVGFSFGSRNIQDLRKSIVELLDNPRLVWGRAHRGKEVVRKNFGWDDIVKKTERIYAGKPLTKS